MKKYLSIIVCAVLVIAACTKEALVQDRMTPDQRSLIGRAVNFNASVVEQYSTKASYNNNGGFNDGDFLIIYREYLNEETKKFGEQAYRVYHRYQEYIPGTNVAIGDPKWKPVEGKTGYNSVADAKHEAGTFAQAEGDSLTWDNGRTVRYRAVGRSNYAGTIGSATGNNKDNYYPDYTYCEWVTASGPTNDVAFTMKHLGTRFIFTPREGNVIKKVELTTDWQDYKYKDNSGKLEDDKKETDRTDDEAKDLANAVATVYNKMCLPAGVDAETGMLKAMTSEKYLTATNFYNLETWTDGIVQYGLQAPDYIASSVQRPVFNRINTNQFIMISNPYDLSNVDSGKPLVLPKETRFRVYIYDVNKGDVSGGEEWEKTYHILDLADVVGSDGKAAYPNGLELVAGDSHQFKVGYYYDKFTVTVDDGSLSWSKQDPFSGNATVDDQPKPSDFDYAWWIAGMKQETPSFSIADVADFMEFIKLVNGTATSVTKDLLQEYRVILRPGGTVDEANSGYWWYTLNASGEKVWHGKTGVETPFSSGEIPAEYSDHIFYQHWVSKDGTAEKELRWDYLRQDSFSFCDEVRQSPYTVSLSADIDFRDWAISPIGIDNVDRSLVKAFKGVFNGNGHLLSNLNVTGEYLFARVDRAEIKNLRIESLNKTSLLNKGTGANYIVGVSINAPCTGSSIAGSLIGFDGDNRNDSYVVGCIHVGASGAAMVGQSDALVMLGCMEAGSGIPAGPALLGAYASSATTRFFNPQMSSVVRWDDFMCNYFDTQLSPGTIAAPGTQVVPGKPVENGKPLSYSPNEYIRGIKTSLLKARQDYFINDKTPYKYLSDAQRLAFYGLAPYKAMDYAIWRYNTSVIGALHPCSMHYVVDNTGFDNRYPELVSGEPVLTPDQQKDWNVLNLNN